MEIVDDVLNVVKVAPDAPFEFASTQFGVRVEDLPQEMDGDESFSPNISTLLSEIMSSTARSMITEQMPEVPPVQVALSSTVLRPKENESQIQVSTSVFVTDSLFQQRDTFVRNNNLMSQGIGSLILDISLRVDGKVQNVQQSFNSNIVQPQFTKTVVSAL